MSKTKKSSNHAAQDAEIIARLNVLDVYRGMGVTFAAEKPRASGKIACYARGRDDAKPSAWVDVNTGRYGDSAGAECLSLWDFAAKFGGHGPDWKDARKHFAHLVGVSLAGGVRPENPIDALEFTEWTPGNERLAALWCAKWKKGASVDAIKLAGGKVAYYPCRKKDGEHVRGEHKVIALPCYGEHMLGADPVAYVLWNINGQPLKVFRGKGREPELVKMKSVGPTYGTLMGLHGLARLAADDAEVDAVWKTAGPTDMLALLAAIPADQRERHLVVTNASGETGDVPKTVSRQFVGHRVHVVHDADKAGRDGATKWVEALGLSAVDVRDVQLPYAVRPKHGLDLRDYLAGLVEGAEENSDAERAARPFADLVALADAAPRWEPAAKAGDDGKPAVSESPDLPQRLSNCDLDETPLAMNTIISAISEITEDWPRRVDNSLFLHEPGQKISWFNSSSSLWGWLRRKCGVIEWYKGVGCAPQEEVYHELRRTATSYDAIEVVPHEPPIPTHYYACEWPKEPEMGKAGDAIEKLVDRFRPSTEADRQLILAMFATVIWGGLPGTRPIFLVTSDAGRGAGKSKLTDMLAMVAGGAIELSHNEDAGQMRKRLLSPEGMTKRVARLDNVKSFRFSWSDLESIVTAPTISGYRNYVGEGSRANNLTWLITLNAPSLSTDIAQRCVIIKLDRSPKIATWEADTIRYIKDHLQEIIADLIAFLKLPKDEILEHSRWATWESEVLARVTDPNMVMDVIRERSAEADAESEELVMIEAVFARRLMELRYNPEAQTVFIPSDIAAGWVCEALREKKSTIVACRILGQFIKETETSRLVINATKRRGRGFVWCGVEPEVELDIEERVEEQRK